MNHDGSLVKRLISVQKTEVKLLGSWVRGQLSTFHHIIVK